MKVTLAILLAVAATGFAIPINQDPNWSLVADGNGQLHMVNLDQDASEFQDEPTPRFNAVSDTIFYLYTKENPIKPQTVTLDNVATLMNSNFKAENPTRFIIHGWNSGPDAGVNTLIRDAYMEKGEFNVFVVDWTEGSNTKNYALARWRVTAMGKLLSRFINFLNKNTQTSFNNIYLIGHSLGAHIAGVAGKYQLGRLNTIIGLEAALPLFSTDSDDRIEPSDAQYVEVIHTNGGNLAFHQPLGQADFYPNGGSKQPGCGIDLTSECSHSRSWRYFAESITTKLGFTSVRCKDYDELITANCSPAGPSQKMGGEPSNFGKGVDGVYVLTTKSRSPFALG